MRLSIWQQFSSNHSGSFTVVGRFVTEHAARTAADTLRDILRRLRDWHAIDENERWYDEQEENDLPSLTPIEVAIQQEYGLQWQSGQRGVDWYRYLPSVIVQFNQDVIFPISETWSDPRTVSELFAKLGGQVYEEVMTDSFVVTIQVQLACQFSEIEGANQVWDQLLTWYATTDGDNPPWTGESDYEYAGIEKLSRDELDLSFTLTVGVEMLPKLLQWLRSHGSQEIVYNFRSDTKSE